MGIFALCISIVGCKSKSATSTKVDNKTERMLKGEWVITSVGTPASNFVKVNSFQIADSKCFEGSIWKLVSNNNKGAMSFSDVTGCPSFSSDITWFLNKDGQFVLKILNADEKAKKVREGYVLDIANVTENSFELIDMVDVAGKKSSVIYHFDKR
jgi:hypothetical protein